MPDSLPNVLLTLSLDDLYALYSAGVADGMGWPRAGVDSPLLTTLRGRWFDAYVGELLAELPNAPAWLEAQQHLKERSV